MIRYRRLTHFDVDVFVEEVLVKNAEWFPGVVETLTRSYVFVCSHGSRDKRCGVCGPPLIKRFKEEIQERSLQDHVTVSACSHIGGHKYAGNVIIFGPGADGVVTGHWYGYVSPDDVPVLLDQHIGKGEVVTHLWRGQMGLSEEQQKKDPEPVLQVNGETEREGFEKEPSQLQGIVNGAGGCCQGLGNSTCCQNLPPEVKPETNNTEECGAQEIEDSKESNTSSSKGSRTRKICAMPTWFERWEREDTYAALAVAAAVVSVVVAYGCYKQTR
uniref:Altered inheritance of mitochondria protein 32 n=2 Tax=Anthurium amnicola TaxID=1678845 RepID=A0A1D1YDD5_9ARAE